jgi:endonuclease/exonuclease/phosphatase family metal-dependent hydrolase
MGDFNAKTGKEEYQKKVAGKYTIHNISNEN